jgi:glycosyltransferase involved in cell wall biosynthesis
MAELSILVPVLARPSRVQPLLDAFHAVTKCDYEVVFLVSTDDRDELRALAGVIDDNVRVIRVLPQKIGDYGVKINTGYRATTSPWMFLAADDVKPHRNWWENSEEFRTAGFGVIGTQDMGNRRVRRGYHSTHTLVSRRYADECGTIDSGPGQVLHEGYPHAYVDDEFVKTARFRNEWAFSHGSLVEHLHPDWAKAEPDATYAKSKNSMVQGKIVYMSRCHMWGEK